ncbi:MAG: hypothetical protein IPO23_02290 [Flavobacterium sp.]|nr:hypothetical protein [Flavobacterium sp.]
MTATGTTARFTNASTVNVTASAAGPTVTLAQLTAGIAPSPLVASTTDKAILGFSATSSAGTPSMTAFNIGTSTTSVSKLTNVKLYTSTDNSYATAGDNVQITGFAFAQTATQLQFSALTEALSTSAKYYFIVADIDASVTGATTAVQPSLTNANVTVATATITGGTITGTNYAFDVAAGTPSISPSGTLAAVNTTYGSASASPTSFTVSGASLTDDIVITPPAGFEISKTAIGSGYATTQTLNQSGGTVGTTTIYVRLANTTAFGTYSGNITLVSTLDGLSVNVATVSSSVAKKH